MYHKYNQRSSRKRDPLFPVAAVGEQQSLPREADNTSPPGTGLQDHQCSSHVFTSRLLWCHHARHTVGCVDTGAWPEILQAAFPGVHQMSLTAGSEATARAACRDPPGLAQHPHTRAQPRGNLDTAQREGRLWPAPGFSSESPGSRWTWPGALHSTGHC